MRIKFVLLGLSLSAFALLRSPASATDSATAAVQTAWAPKVVEVVPAWDDDLPLDSTSFMTQTETSVPMGFATGSWVCTVFAANPFFNGAASITASGSQTCSGSGWGPQQVKVTLQKYAGLGIWNNLASGYSGWTNSNPVTKKITYSCWHTGSEEYRVVTDGWAELGAYGWSVQSLNYVRVFC